MPSIVISDSEFHDLPEAVQQALIEKFLSPSPFAGTPEISGTLTSPVPAETASEDEEMPDLSPAQAKRLVTGITDKTTRVLRFIANTPKGVFLMDDVMKDSEIKEASDLRGVWAGITRRSRNILGDPNLMLIWWNEQEGGAWQGRVSEMTHRSLRKAFGIT